MLNDKQEILLIERHSHGVKAMVRYKGKTLLFYDETQTIIEFREFIENFTEAEMDNFISMVYKDLKPCQNLN